MNCGLPQIGLLHSNGNATYGIDTCSLRPQYGGYGVVGIRNVAVRLELLAIHLRKSLASTGRTGEFGPTERSKS